MTPSELATRLDDIELELEAGTYRPGPWKRVVEALKRLPREQRVALSDQVDRVSDLLHRRSRHVVLPLWAGLGAEAAGAALGAGLLAAALASESNLLALGAMGAWASAFEPLVKVGAGGVIGIRYSYAFLFKGVEPRFKMRFGTYLACPRAGRVALHLAGCVGSPLAAWLVGRVVRKRLPTAARACDVVGWGVNLLNACMLGAGLLGATKYLGIPVGISSGGSAGLELRAWLQGGGGD